MKEGEWISGQTDIVIKFIRTFLDIVCTVFFSCLLVDKREDLERWPLLYTAFKLNLLRTNVKLKRI